MAHEIISKITKGSNAGGALKYDIEKEGATLLETNLASTDRQGMAAEFEAVAASNSRCKANVIHVSLSSGNQRLNDDQWREAGKVYMKEMGLDQNEHQYTLTRHSDTGHDHCHLSINRINMKTGKAWSDSNDRKKSHEACRKVEKKLGLEATRTETKEGRFEQTKTDLNNAVKASRGRGLEGLKDEMQARGYTINVNSSKSTGKVSGISIKANTDGKSWKASELRKGGYRGMEKQLNEQPSQQKIQSNNSATGKALANGVSKNLGKIGGGNPLKMPSMLPKMPMIGGSGLVQKLASAMNQTVKKTQKEHQR